jgi:hypothetical protein
LEGESGLDEESGTLEELNSGGRGLIGNKDPKGMYERDKGSSVGKGRRVRGEGLDFIFSITPVF